MTHYHVWFSFKQDIPEQQGLEAVAAFLSRLCTESRAVDFHLARNNGQPPRSKLPPYHADIRFANAAALGSAIKWQAQEGIHAGLHGQMLEVIDQFHVEVFCGINLCEASNSQAAEN